MDADGGRGPKADQTERSASTALDRLVASDIDAEPLLETIAESASECFVVVDERARMLFVDQTVEELFGYEPSALVGERLTEVIPPEYRERYLMAFAEYLRTGERTLDWDHVEFPGLRRDGSEVPLLIALREFERDDDSYFVGIMRDAAQRAEQRDRMASEQAFVDSVLDAVPDVVYAFDESGQFLRWNERAKEVTGYTDEEIASMEPLAFIPERDHRRVAASLNRVLTDGAVETIESALVTKDGTEIPYEFTGAPLIDDGEIIGETGVGRDVSERKRREEQLRRLDELNTVIRSVDQALIEASTRSEIEATVCDQLVTEGGYVGAVIADGAGTGVDVNVNASAGVDASVFESCAATADGGDDLLATRALRSRSVRVATDLRESATPPWERDAREQEYDALAVIPVVNEDRAFGVLAVFADGDDAFGERERTVLRELGEGIGNAISAALTHQLLYADTVTEVELRSTDPDNAFVALSTEVGCRMELTHSVSYGDDVVMYFSVADAAPERVLAVAESFDEFHDVKHFDTYGRTHRFQVIAETGSISLELSKYGATPVDGAADHGTGHLTVHLPPEVDVRAFVDGIRSVYPETELVGRREVEQSLQTPWAFRQDLSAEMTEKQRAALEAAHSAGYFEWPSRTCNAEDVADMLGIAPQTFHQHLRVAQAKLLNALFGDPVADEVE